VRWIYSAKDRPIELQLSHRTFSATLGFVVWVNGERVLTADLNRSGKNTAMAGRAQKGLELLLVRNDHLQCSGSSLARCGPQRRTTRSTTCAIR
jgi:hypothetical protein